MILKSFSSISPVVILGAALATAIYSSNKIPALTSVCHSKSFSLNILKTEFGVVKQMVASTFSKGVHSVSSKESTLEALGSVDHYVPDDLSYHHWMS